MSYDTTVRATSPCDWRMMFLQARKAVGIGAAVHLPPDEAEAASIPDEWPFWTDGVHGAKSEPGGFPAAVAVRWSTDDDGYYGPPGTWEVWFQSSPCGPESDVLHTLYVEELGAWLHSQGVSYVVCTNRGDWLDEVAA